MSERALILFDVDGTIFNSKPIILDGFTKAFRALGLEVPTDDEMARTIGLSFEVAVKHMAPSLDDAGVENFVQAYRAGVGSTYTNAPFYPGMRRLIGALAQFPQLTLGAATGKKLVGLNPMLEANGISDWFAVRQTPDHNPSKPHPSMILSAIADHNFDKDRVVMIGDTSFDIDMAHAAGVKSIGVSWGYHGEELVNAKPTILVDHPTQIFDSIREWGLL